MTQRVVDFPLGYPCSDVRGGLRSSLCSPVGECVFLLVLLVCLCSCASGKSGISRDGMSLSGAACVDHVGKCWQWSCVGTFSGVVPSAMLNVTPLRGVVGACAIASLVSVGLSSSSSSDPGYALSPASLCCDACSGTSACCPGGLGQLAGVVWAVVAGCRYLALISAM